MAAPSPGAAQRTAARRRLTTRTFLTSCAKALAAWRSAPARVDEPAHYALREPIGRGGMGTIWSATNTHTGTPAAVKLVHDTVDSPECKARFLREAEVTGRLTSPHTVRLYHAGQHASGAFFYAMELLHGTDLMRLIDRYGPLPEARIVFMMRQVCQSLAEAHAAGIIHRDIKPENLFVTQVGRRHDFMKVLDFGLAKFVKYTPCGRQLPQTPRQELTIQGAIPGTAAVIAPEQVDGKRPLDHRVDIYALGCVAYRALTGQGVFVGSIDGQLMFAHAHIAPDRPSERLGRQVDPAFEALLMRCLEKEPDDRVQTMQELDDALAALPIGRQWSHRRARRWWSTVGRRPD